MDIMCNERHCAFKAVVPLGRSGIGGRERHRAGVELGKLRNEAGFCDARGMQFLPLAVDTFGGFSLKAQAAIARVANEAASFVTRKRLRHLSACPRNCGWSRLGGWAIKQYDGKWPLACRTRDRLKPSWWRT